MTEIAAAVPAVPTGNPLNDEELASLRLLPTDTLNTLRSKLVQIIDTVYSFQSELQNYPIHPLALTYPTILEKLLILLNHLRALTVALATPQPPTLTNPYAPGRRNGEGEGEGSAERRALVGSVGVRPRSLEGVEGNAWVLERLMRTQLLPDLEATTTTLLSTLPPPPPSTQPTIPSLQSHITTLTTQHDNHIAACKGAMRNARGGGEGKEDKWDWKARVEVEGEGWERGMVGEGKGKVKTVLGFMRDGRVR